MDLLLLLFCVLAFAFLITIAAIYIVRPHSLLIYGGGVNASDHDIDMWKAFNVSLLLAILAVMCTAYGIYKCNI